MRFPRIPPLPRRARVVGAALLAVDAAMVGLYLFWKLDWVVHDAFDIGYDLGLSEWVQYAKMAALAGVGAVLYRRTRQPVFAVLAALFLGLLVDDAGMLHERFGVVLGGALGLPSVAGLAPHDFGEVLFVALWVGPLFVAGLVAARRSDAAARRTAGLALGALAVLAGFGVGVDLLHQSLTTLFDVKGLHSVLTVVEEGGEMVVATAMVVGALALVAPRAPAGGDGHAPGVPISWPPSITNRPPVTNDDASDAR